MLSKQSVDDIFVRAPLVALLVTNLPTDLWVRKKGEGRNIEKGREREEIWKKNIHPLEKGMAIYTSILAWRISRQSNLVGYLSIGLQRVRHDR